MLDMRLRTHNTPRRDGLTYHCCRQRRKPSGASCRRAFVVRLRNGVRAIQEKSYDFLEELLADVHGAVDASAGLRPVHFSDRDLPRQSFSAVMELDVEQIPSQNHGYAVERVPFPSC